MPHARGEAAGQARWTAGSPGLRPPVLAMSGAPAQATRVLVGAVGAPMTAGGLAAGRQVRVPGALGASGY